MRGVVSVWAALGAVIVYAGRPGMLLIKRDPTMGSLLEYLDPKLEKVYHARLFPAAQRSFDLTNDDEDIVVMADTQAGWVARVTGAREVIDHYDRPMPRAVSYNAQDGIVAWIEGAAEAMLSVTVYDSITASPIVTQRAPLMDGCGRAMHGASFRPPDGDRWFIFFVCDGRLHVVELQFPLPTVAEPHRPLKATSTSVRHDTDLSNITAITAGDHGTLLVGMSDGHSGCIIVRFHLDLHAANAEDMLKGEEVVYQCTGRSAQRLTGVATDGDWVYIAQTSTSVDHRKTFIGRFSLGGTVVTTPAVEVVMDRGNPLLAQSDLFSPYQIRVKTATSNGVTTVYWVNLYDGRLRRYSFLAEEMGFRPLQSVLAEPSRGTECPLAAVMINTTEREEPLVVYSDHGTNAIKQYQPVFRHGRALEGLPLLPRIVALTSSAPSDLLYVEETKMLFWVEAEKQMVVAFNLAKSEVVANLTYRLDPESTRAQFSSLAYLPRSERIYVSDRSPQHPRILSWKAPTSPEQGFLGGGAAVAWYGDSDWAPEAIVGDPHTNVIYASSTVDGTIRAIFLTPRFSNVEGAPGASHGAVASRSRIAMHRIPTLSPAELKRVKNAVNKEPAEVAAGDIQVLEKLLEMRKQQLLIEHPIGYSPRHRHRSHPDSFPANDREHRPKDDFLSPEDKDDDELDDNHDVEEDAEGPHANPPHEDFPLGEADDELPAVPLDHHERPAPDKQKGHDDHDEHDGDHTHDHEDEKESHHGGVGEQHHEDDADDGDHPELEDDQQHEDGLDNEEEEDDQGRRRGHDGKHDAADDEEDHAPRAKKHWHHKQRQLREPQTVGPITRAFFRQKLAVPVKHMWLNDGYLHWLQLRQHSDTGTEMAILYKETLSTNNPTLPIDESKVFELVTAQTDVFVSYAAFFEVRETMVPRTAGEWALVLSAVGAVAASFGIVRLALRARRSKAYGQLADSHYNDMSPAEPYTDREPSR